MWRLISSLTSSWTSLKVFYKITRKNSYVDVVDTPEGGQLLFDQLFVLYHVVNVRLFGINVFKHRVGLVFFRKLPRFVEYIQRLGFTLSVHIKWIYRELLVQHQHPILQTFYRHHKLFGKS